MRRYKSKTVTHCLRGHARTPENVSPGRYCKICHVDNTKHRKDIKEIRNASRQRKLGWNDQLYTNTKKKQKNRCAICKVKFKYRLCEKGKPANTNACRDHKHGNPPKPRGLLCHCCNLMLGNAKESIKTLKRAIQYLKMWSKE